MVYWNHLLGQKLIFLWIVCENFYPEGGCHLRLYVHILEYYFILFANSTINEDSLIYEIRISNDKFPCCSKWQSWWSCSELCTNEKSPQECSFSLPRVVFLTLPDTIQWCWWIVWSCGRWRTQGRWWSGL